MKQKQRSTEKIIRILRPADGDETFGASGLSLPGRPACLVFEGHPSASG